MELLRIILIICSILSVFLGILGFIAICEQYIPIKKRIIEAILFVLFIGIMVVVFNRIAISIKIPDEKHRIYSVKSASEIHGRFALFGGHIDEEQYYFTYEKDKYGLILKKYETDLTRIIEDENDKPYIVKKDGITKDDVVYVLHVPKGTVILDYKIK